jgi:hypothetical protein
LEDVYDYDSETTIEEIVSTELIMTTLQENGLFFPNEKVIQIDASTDEVNVEGVMDWNGNIIWQCPYNKTVEAMNVKLQFGISHIMLQFTPTYTDSSDELGELLTGAGFVYDCRHPGLFVDSYQEYVLKNRDYDIAMRSIQSEKELWKAGFSTAENIGFGFAFGQTKGGIAAGAGGIIETIGTFLINQEFDPRIQRQYDNLYAKMTDQISLVGDSITNLQYYKPMYKFTLIMDVATQDRMNTDIEVNGFVCDETIGNLESIFNTGVVLQADNVTIEGATCLDAKQQTVYRLQNGVEFK